ncbi:hypothetical protein AX15_000118 [Amanita polypyramis BW_CC]|nr:hypothetical protein AX15_000118 [Amanita polypyramis BW_CC]
MVATQLRLLGLITLCTLVYSSAIQLYSLDKRQNANVPGAHVHIDTSKLGSQSKSNAHRSTEDTVMKAGPEGYDYHHFFQTSGNDQQQHPREPLANAMDAAQNLHGKRQEVEGAPEVRGGANLTPNNNDGSNSQMSDGRDAL